MNPIRLTAALLASLMFGWLFMLISVPRYYAALFNLDNVAKLSPAAEPFLHTFMISSQQPLLAGCFIGCTFCTIIYNLIRYAYTRFTSNLLLAIALSLPVCQPKHEPTDFEITYKSGCLGERNAKANDYC